MTDKITTSCSTPTQFVVNHIQACLNGAIAAAFGPHVISDKIFVEAAKNRKFGDFQTSAALVLVKSLAPTTARQIAEKIVAAIAADEVCEKPTADGPGMINFRLQRSFIAAQLQLALADDRLGLQKAVAPRKIVVDMSSPNIAKEMHVGHLRSTIIGESLARLLSFIGHDVVKINHVGDWGTQFGMLIAELKEKHPQALTKPASLSLGDIVVFYKQAKQHFDDDPVFQKTARQEVVNLQSGGKDSLIAWKLLCDQSRTAFQKIYDLLDVQNLIEQGESFYNPLLAALVRELSDSGLAVQSEGALCVFLDGFASRDGQPLPLIVQKQDGGYNYATTDLAALRYRLDHDGATDLIYVVDAGQSNHLEMVAQTARLAGWVKGDVRIQHVPFGLVCGADGKKLKTRSGDTVRLQDLLDEAVAHAHKELVSRLSEKGLSETDSWIDSTAQAIGIGAVKYSDLSLDRTTNYKFELTKMLSLQGNTAPFMMYAYTRIQSIIREGGVDMAALSGQKELSFSEPLELDLAKQLLQFADALQSAVDELKPNRLCEYLFELSQRFNRFYHDHPVLNAEEPQRTSRLILCDLTARTLKLGLTLLAIPLVERM